MKGYQGKGTVCESLLSDVTKVLEGELLCFYVAISVDGDLLA